MGNFVSEQQSGISFKIHLDIWTVTKKAGALVDFFLLAGFFGFNPVLDFLDLIQYWIKSKKSKSRLPSVW